MHVSHILLASLTSIACGLSGCVHDEPTLKMMNERAEYQDEAAESSDLSLGSTETINEEGQKKQRPEPRIAMIWVHPQRISEREQFWGGWLSLRLEQEYWQPSTADAFEPAAPKKGIKDEIKTR